MPVTCKNIFATECRTATNLKYKKMLGFNFALIFFFIFFISVLQTQTAAKSSAAKTAVLILWVTG